MRAGCSCCSWVKGKHPWQTPIWSCRFWWKRWSGSDPLGTHLRGAGGRSGHCLPPGTCCRKCHHLASVQKRYLQLVLMLWKSLQSTGGEFKELGFESFGGGHVHTPSVWPVTALWDDFCGISCPSASFYGPSSMWQGSWGEMTRAQGPKDPVVGRGRCWCLIACFAFFESLSNCFISF